MTGIYLIYNVVNSKMYIGSSSNIEGRVRTHKKHLTEKRHSNPRLQYEYNRYSKNFIFAVLEQVSYCEDLVEREQYWLDYYEPEYNIMEFAYSALGNTNALGYRHSEKTKQVLRDFNLGKRLSKETKEKLRCKIPNRLGVKLSKETKEKLREINIGKKHTLKTRNKISSSLK